MILTTGKYTNLLSKLSFTPTFIGPHLNCVFKLVGHVTSRLNIWAKCAPPSDLWVASVLPRLFVFLQTPANFRPCVVGVRRWGGHSGWGIFGGAVAVIGATFLFSALIHSFSFFSLFLLSEVFFHVWPNDNRIKVSSHAFPKTALLPRKLPLFGVEDRSEREEQV